MRTTFFGFLYSLLLSLLMFPMLGNAEDALTVTELRKQGIQPLDDAALKRFVRGKILIIKNKPANKLYEVTFYENGQRLLLGLSDISMSDTAARSFHGGSVAQGIAPYDIYDNKLITTFSGQKFETQIYKIDNNYVAADVGEDAVNWVVLDRAKRRPNVKIITTAALQEDGFKPLDDAALKDFIVGKTLILSNRGTGEQFEAMYATDGQRTIRNISQKKLNYMALGTTTTGTLPQTKAPYEINNSYLVTTLDGKKYRAQVYKVNDTYYGAGGGEGGIINWEIKQAQQNKK